MQMQNHVKSLSSDKNGTIAGDGVNARRPVPNFVHRNDHINIVPHGLLDTPDYFHEECRHLDLIIHLAKTHRLSELPIFKYRTPEERAQARMISNGRGTYLLWVENVTQSE